MVKLEFANKWQVTKITHSHMTFDDKTDATDSPSPLLAKQADSSVGAGRYPDEKPLTDRHGVRSAGDAHKAIALEDLFSIDELQTLQDQFAQATGVASVITRPDGTPVTRTSNFCRLCKTIIRCTEKGRRNCFLSDAVIGRHHPEGPIVQQCLSGGLWDAGASITVNGHHVANWLIGQVRNEAQDDAHMRSYAREIGADEDAFLEAFHEAPSMPLEKFQQIAQVLFTLAEQLSSSAYQNILQARFIEERNRTEAILREKEARLIAVLEGSQLGFWDWDITCGIVQRNDRWAEMLGYTLSEVSSSTRQWKDLLHPEDRDRALKSIHDHLEGRTPCHVCEYRMRAKDGSYRWVLDQARIVARDPAGFPTRMSGTHTDITERKQMEVTQQEMDAQRNRQQKLEGLVKLAGGIAHDFNNLLQALMGSVDLILPELPADSPAHADVANMLQYCQRMASLSRQMQVCSGGLVFAPRSLDLNTLLTASLPELNECLCEGLSLSCDLTPGLPMVAGDENLLRQAIRNLVTNASEALAGTPGTVTLRTGTSHLDASVLAQAVLCSDVPAGDFVTLDILDTGCGMDQVTLHHLFDPFFTTKPTGRGLGLPEVMGIMRAHQGTIFLTSQPNKGTTIRLAWPSLPDVPSETAPVHKAAQNVVPRTSDGITILVVDDEPGVLTISERFLVLSGYRVLTATNGKEGVDTFRSAPESIDLILLDLTMPKMDGVQAFREICRIRPDVPVIIASGYSEQDTLKRFGSDRPSGFLQKPYRRETLLRHVSSFMPIETGDRHCVTP